MHPVALTSSDDEVDESESSGDGDDENDVPLSGFQKAEMSDGPRPSSWQNIKINNNQNDEAQLGQVSRTSLTKGRLDLLKQIFSKINAQTW